MQLPLAPCHRVAPCTQPVPSVSSSMLLVRPRHHQQTRACPRDATEAPVSTATSSRQQALPPPPAPHLQLTRRQLLLGSAATVAAASASQLDAPALAAPGPRTDQPIIDEGKVFLLTPEEQEALTLSERQVLILNQRIQAQNRAPAEFPQFIREGFDVKVIAPGFKITPEGIIYKDFKEGTGEVPQEGQEAVFHYTGFNESATPIDSSYQKGRPAQTQIGTGGLIPGFEMALRTMKVGTQRRFIVPPALGPPVGPSTFFSAKQCEVFDVELLSIRTCTRKQTLMFSSVVCE